MSMIAYCDHEIVDYDDEGFRFCRQCGERLPIGPLCRGCGKERVGSPMALCLRCRLDDEEDAR